MCVQVIKAYKFGVLYWKTGQTEEDQLYQNTQTSPDFEEFLSVLGEKVPLMGWDRFKGGLRTYLVLLFVVVVLFYYYYYVVVSFCFFWSFVFASFFSSCFKHTHSNIPISNTISPL